MIDQILERIDFLLAQNENRELNLSRDEVEELEELRETLTDYIGDLEKPINIKPSATSLLLQVSLTAIPKNNFKYRGLREINANSLKKPYIVPELAFRKIVKALLPNTLENPLEHDLEPSTDGLESKLPTAKKIAREMRKSWGGESRVRPKGYSINPKVVYGYIRRDFVNKTFAKEIPLYSYKDKQWAALQSLSQRQPIKAEGLELLKSNKLDKEEAMKEAYLTLGVYLFKDLLAYRLKRSGRLDAYVEIIGDEEVWEDNLLDLFEPTVEAFDNLEDDIKAIIADAWEQYDREAFSKRQERYGYALTPEKKKKIRAARDSGGTHRDIDDPRL